MLLVGEQPGDEEDRQGKPFVGPAGRVLRSALAEAGIPDDDVFLTNAVKHFSWEPRGTRRIHKTPTQQQIAACIDWLDAEIAALRPRVIVALGATALRAILARRIAVGAARGRSLAHASGAHVVATWHPSAILRAPDDEGRATLHADLIADLKRAWQLAQAS